MWDLLGNFNEYLGGDPSNPDSNGLSVISWVMLLLGYSYVASVLPVWTLLQPRDYINSLQLLSALGLGRSRTYRSLPFWRGRADPGS